MNRVTVVCFLLACGGSSPGDTGVDAGADVGVRDAGGREDAGRNDTGARDTGAGDTGARDTGAPLDAGPALDTAPVVVPNRIVFIHIPHGIAEESWVPRGTGRDFELSEVLAPLEPLRDKLTIVAGLDVAAQDPRLGGTHFWGPPSLLTGNPGPLVDSSRYEGGARSLDLVLGDATSTPIRALQLGVQTSDRPNSEISYLGPGEPVRREPDPERAFDALFAGVEPAGIEEREFLARIEDVVSAPIDLDRNESFPEITRRQFAVLLGALYLQPTHVATLRFSDATSRNVFRWIGEEHTEVWGLLAHRTNDPMNARLLAEMWRWFVEEIARFAQELDGIDAGDGASLLDHTIIVCLSETGVPHQHSSEDIPVFLIGGEATGLATGQFLRAERLHTDLLLTLGQLMGLEITTFGDPSLEASTIFELLR